MKTILKTVLCVLLTAFAVGQVSVEGYTKKDGTIVSAYTRSSPSKGDTKLYTPPPNPCVVYEGLIVCNGKVLSPSQIPAFSGPVARDSRGRIARSPAAKKNFQSMDPCPATGSPRGHCPGYVIDHIVPLVCGGLDDPVNMQWQKVADAKAKDKWERKMCGK